MWWEEEVGLMCARGANSPFDRVIDLASMDFLDLFFFLSHAASRALRACLARPNCLNCYAAVIYLPASFDPGS